MESLLLCTSVKVLNILSLSPLLCIHIYICLSRGVWHSKLFIYVFKCLKIKLNNSVTEWFTYCKAIVMKYTIWMNFTYCILILCVHWFINVCVHWKNRNQCESACVCVCETLCMCATVCMCVCDLCAHACVFRTGCGIDVLSCVPWPGLGHQIESSSVWGISEASQMRPVLPRHQ